ncbi:MAG: hypothetical protein M3Q45_09740, partial [Chloroflexota bacterium]|nr:hypothetical protein [Chloroflexota bacterium]
TGVTSITIVKDAQPDSRRNFRFKGDLGIFRLNDRGDDDSDDEVNTRTFEVEPGVYTVTESPVAHWYLTQIVCDAPGSDVADLEAYSVAITVMAGQQITCTFVNQYEGAVKTRVYHDEDGNGTRNGEPGLKKWDVTLYDAAGTVVNQRRTSSSGKVHFWKLRPGDYTVCETLKQGWFNSQPGVLFPTFGNQPCYSLVVAPGQQWTVEFGNHDNESLVGSADVNAAASGASVVTVVDTGDDSTVVDEDEESPLLEAALFLPLVER